jgi:hypothetical protein
MFAVALILGMIAVILISGCLMCLALLVLYLMEESEKVEVEIFAVLDCQESRNIEKVVLKRTGVQVYIHCGHHKAKFRIRRALAPRIFDISTVTIRGHPSEIAR